MLFGIWAVSWFWLFWRLSSCSLDMSGTLSKLESWISSETAKKGNKVKVPDVSYNLI